MIVSLITAYAYLISVAQLNYAPLCANYYGTAYKISSTTYTGETHILKIISVIDSRAETLGGRSSQKFEMGVTAHASVPQYFEK